MPNDERQVDVAVVGAGLAGLTAARAIAAAGASAVVLEARDRVGGRVLNEAIGNDKVVEMGGQWIGPTQDRMYALAEELGINTFPTYFTGDTIAVLEGKRYRFTGEMPRLNPVAMADVAQAVFRLERLARRIPVEQPWRAPRAAFLDAETLDTWIRRNVRTRTARALLHLFMTLTFASEPATFSLLHALFYFRSGTSFDIITRISGGAQQDRFVGGSQLVALRLAERLGDAVLLNAPVRRVEQMSSHVLITSDSGTVHARLAIVAIPPTLAARIDYAPALPGRRDQLTQRLPQGSVIKVQAIYDEPFWRADGLTGAAFHAGLPVSVTIDNSPPEGTPGALVGFIEGHHARRLGEADAAERRRVVLDSFVRHFGKRAASPRLYLEKDWTAEEWTRGCYGAHFPPGVWTAYGPALRAPVGRIHWAGTETSAIWNGYMEGAVRSGDRAAGEALAALG